MSQITYVTGDLFNYAKLHNNPKPELIYLCHIVNNLGVFGSGFVIPLGKMYPEAKQRYLDSYNDYSLGNCQYVKTQGIYVVNMFAQDGISNYAKNKNVKPFQYGYFAECLLDLRDTILPKDEVIMPLVGAGLGGGNWDIIEEIIENILGKSNVTIFQLPGQEVR